MVAIDPEKCQIRLLLSRGLKGPMFGCEDLECFEECVKITKKERGIE